MGLWQIFDADGVAQDKQFDDGLAFMPGEEGFSTDGVAKRAKALGKGFTFSLIGVPNWHARVEAEQREAQEKADAEAALVAKETKANLEAAQKDAARQKIAELLDPEGFAKAQAIAAIKAEHAELMPFADKDQQKALRALAKERIAAL